MPRLQETSEKCSNGKTSFKVEFSTLTRENARYLRTGIFAPSMALRGMCIRMIAFYQRHHKVHRCPYVPSCSEYAKRCIGRYGVIAGIALGSKRLLKCNPFVRVKRVFDPAPDPFFKRRWLI